jgi:pimeloyl-ACP methyl ester carboxylesterase
MRTIRGTLLLVAMAASVAAQNSNQTCGTAVTFTNVYGQNGQFYLFLFDPTVSTTSPVIAQNFTAAVSNGVQTIPLNVDQNGNPVRLRLGVTYTLELETYGPGVCCGAFSNYTLALTGDLMFTNLSNLPSGATCSSATMCSGFLPPSIPGASNSFSFTLNSTGALCPSLIDPVQALTDPTQPNLISQDPATLAQQGRPVDGVAADGVTRLVLRIPAITASDQIYLSVLDGNGNPSTSVNNDGGLDIISGQNFAPAISTPLTVTQPISGSSTYMAFALYQAPIDFVRTGQGQGVPCEPSTPTCTPPTCNPCDYAQSNRTVYIQVQDGQVVYKFPISIVRPPVVLVHGLTAKSSSWDTFKPFINDQLFGIYYSNYGTPVAGLSAISPNYPQILPVIGSQLGLQFNAPTVLSDIQFLTSLYELSGPPAFPARVASVQADIVAHSMGGLVTRMAARSQADFFSPKTNYLQGPVHKMITLGTPHLGSPNGIQSLDGRPDNNCLATILALAGIYELQSAIVNGTYVTGGAFDLQGDGKGGLLSSALQVLQAPALHPMVVAPLAGNASPAEYQALNSSALKLASDLFCYNLTLPYSPNSIPWNYNSTGWPILMAGYTDAEWQAAGSSGLPGVPSDGVVPLTSALNNFPSYDLSTGAPDSANGQNTFDGIVHSSGVNIEGFGGPYLQNDVDIQSDYITPVQDRVVQLLNTPVTASVFELFP